MIARPLTFRQACEFIQKIHRHHRPPRGWKFGIGAMCDGELVGVVVVGRPVSRMMDDGDTAEVTRLCTNGTPNACSFLYARARQTAFAMGYTRIITYILESEPGTSLKASGWKMAHITKGGSWDRAIRPRDDKHPTCRKQLWEVSNGTQSAR